MPSLGNPRDVDDALRKRKGKEPDPEIEHLKMAVKNRIKASKNKRQNSLILIRIEKNLIEVNKNLKEIITLMTAIKRKKTISV